MKAHFLVVAVIAVATMTCCAKTNAPARGISHEELWHPLVGTTLTDPYEWCLRHSYGPAVKGPPNGISLRQWAREIGWHSLLEASADIDGDGLDDLLIRPEAAARVWPVFVFRRTRAAVWNFAGTFAMSWMLQPGAPGSPSPPTILVYEACGGHFGYVKKVKLTADGFVIEGKIEEVWSGDGHDEGTKRLEALFPGNSVMQWRDEREKPQPAT
jgi:hypothetical protein